MTAKLLAWISHLGLGPLVFVGLGIAIILGILKPARAGRIVGRIVLCLLFGPLLLAIVLDLLHVGLSLAPWWLLLLVVPIALVALLRLLLNLFIGKEAAGQAIGTLAADGIYAVGRAIRAGFRLVGRLFRQTPRSG
ncbi:MAG: hypothetical protein F9K16_02935 [Thermoanaerobaculia bacterium]|nr:MAG: hypothetical protein F9K16_02935 [Thermoanaerobaculia bacterium]MBZ0102129.1 hypothetical protein [Thermoanaerobaculia bacterium]